MLMLHQQMLLYESNSVDPRRETRVTVTLQLIDSRFAFFMFYKIYIHFQDLSLTKSQRNSLHTLYVSKVNKISFLFSVGYFYV